MSRLACEAQAPGGRILETSGWIVEHTVGSVSDIAKPARAGEVLRAEGVTNL